MNSSGASCSVVGKCFAAATIFFVSCTLQTKFWKYDEKAPVRVISEPPGFRGVAFGTLMAGLSVSRDDVGEPAGLAGDFLVVAGMAPSQVVLLRFSDGENILGGDLYDTLPDSREVDIAALEHGASIATAPLWYDGEVYHKGCIAVGAPGRGEVRISCLDGFERIERDCEGGGESMATVVRGAGMPAEAFLTGGGGSACLVTPRHEAELAFSSNGGSNNGGSVPISEEIGCAVAAGSFLDESSPYLAVGSNGRVYVFLDNGGGSYRLAECIEPGTELEGRGFGSVLVSGDVDGDGNSDLLVSSRADISERVEEVVIISGVRYKGSGFIFQEVCANTGEIEEGGELWRIRCTDDPEHDVFCGAGPLFGSSLAIGELDGTAPVEVVVGSPGAVVESKEKAGAAFIFHPVRSNSHLLVGVLRIAEPSVGQRLGASVVVLNVAGRDKLFVGAPSEGRIFLFSCPRVGNDTTAGRDSLCR